MGPSRKLILLIALDLDTIPSAREIYKPLFTHLARGTNPVNVVSGLNRGLMGCVNMANILRHPPSRFYSHETELNCDVVFARRKTNVHEIPPSP